MSFAGLAAQYITRPTSTDTVTATGYTDDLKLHILYELLKMYAHLLRPGIYPDDTRFLYLMTMCRLIDYSKEQIRRATVDEIVALPSLDKLDVWHLGALSRDFSVLLADQNTAAAVGRLTMLERMKKLESLIAYDDTYI